MPARAHWTVLQSVEALCQLGRCPRPPGRAQLGAPAAPLLILVLAEAPCALMPLPRRAWAGFR
eukprot:2254379-Pleurochrysis_carterae.AAC.2